MARMKRSVFALPLISEGSVRVDITVSACVWRRGASGSHTGAARTNLTLIALPVCVYVCLRGASSPYVRAARTNLTLNVTSGLSPCTPGASDAEWRPWNAQ